jgi:hypothetical protein
MSLGAMPQDKILHSMELLGTRVVPEVKKYAAARIDVRLDK